MVNKFVKKDDVEKVTIGNIVILILLYVDDIVLYRMLKRLRVLSAL